MAEKVSTQLYAAFSVLAGQGKALAMGMNVRGFSAIAYDEYKEGTQGVQQSGLRQLGYTQATEILAFKKLVDADVVNGVVRRIDTKSAADYVREQAGVVEYRVVAAVAATPERDAQVSYNYGSGPAYRHMN